MANRERLLLRALALPISGALLVAACADDDSAGPERGVTASDLEELESRVGDMEGRVGTLEEDVAGLGEVGGGTQGDDRASADAPDAADQLDLLGQTVTVSGEVTSGIPPYAFTISGTEDLDRMLDENEAATGEGVLVVGGQEFGVFEGQVVQVVGEVALFRLPDVEEVLGVGLDDALFVDHEGQVALLASSVELIVDDGEG